ncbi:MAG: tRNA lysidine(34) synthetase TilS [Oscillospiraceae bacterium]|nr:tRNA lysidine(34) synthetase TilS [Oscillospiraceae bacterium]
MKNNDMLIQQISPLAEEYDMIPAHSVVLCAVSGGADSVCLLHVLHMWQQKTDFALHAAHYNHRLRGDASDGDADFVRALCRQWNIPCHMGSGDVRQTAAQAGRGLEETARQMRYQFLQETAETLSADRIATAHTADDNVETILMRLVRGSGLSGLCGIPPRRGKIVRPFLELSRQDIMAYLNTYALPYREDESNKDLTYTRNRLRHEVLPILRELNPNLPSTVAAAVRSLRQDNDCLNAAAARHRTLIQPAERSRVLSRTALLRLPPALSSRLFYQTLDEMGASRKDISAVHISAIRHLIEGEDPSGRVTLPHGIVVQRVYDELLFAPESDFSDSFSPVSLPAHGQVHFSHLPWTITVTPCSAPDSPPTGNMFFLDAVRAAQEPLTLRPRQTGDAITPARGGGTKSIKKWMIDIKIPRHLRDLVPVFASEAQVAAVAGLGPAAQWAARPGQPALKIEIEGIPLYGTRH